MPDPMLKQVMLYTREFIKPTGPDVRRRQRVQAPEKSGVDISRSLRLWAGNHAPALAVPVLNQGQLPLLNRGCAPNSPHIIRSQRRDSAQLRAIQVRMQIGTGHDA